MCIFHYILNSSPFLYFPFLNPKIQFRVQFKSQVIILFFISTIVIIIKCTHKQNFNVMHRVFIFLFNDLFT